MSFPVPRINHWAKMVVEIDRLVSTPLVFISQTDKICNSILDMRGKLLSIYLHTWDAVDIGYPGILETMRSWNVEPAEPVDDPVKFLRDLYLFVASVKVDLLAIQYVMDDKAAQEALENDG